MPNPDLFSISPKFDASTPLINGYRSLDYAHIQFFSKFTIVILFILKAQTHCADLRNLNAPASNRNLLCVDDDEMKQQPLRSQSFKHRSRPVVEVRRMAYEDVGPHERRKSTPTVSRRQSLQRSRIMEPRTDVWPEAKPNNSIEERFLKLPDSEDYTRVRQFKIDEKGAVVSRGDSFRRKRTPTNKSDKSPSPFPVSMSTDSARGSRSESEASDPVGDELSKLAVNDVANASTSHKTYKTFVIGDTGTGKSSLISQLITSEYKNAFADEIRNCGQLAFSEDYENTVSICIGGVECDLVFFESDLNDTHWLTNEVHAFVVVYSIDSRSSWKQATNAIEIIRESPECRNIPILVAGNKVDLERKRTVTKQEVRSAKAALGFEHFEISVALDHDVDDLLVGLVAEIQEAFSPDVVMQKPSPRHQVDDFHSAIRRYSQRKKKALPSDPQGGKCSVLSPTSLFAKFRNWRRGNSPRIETK
ncbi:unnamed protein product [Caenorhabditis bovis]|uniref:Uncharacterized protein n=1 Tax=Caenorhabditis bovis TaxID=2654633 RepID=A0A8S1F2H6_9PELO|nr:unnamed protein product [Caenorhabditis bovis]